MTDTQILINENKKLKEKVFQLQREIDFFREKFKLAQSRQFGASSEKSPDQADWLFNEAEAIADIQNTEVAVEATADVVGTESTAPIAAKKTGRKPLPKDLPRETRIIDVTEAEKVCPCCNGDLHRIGEEKVSSWNIFLPA